MTAFTLRLDNTMAKQLDQFCKEHGYKKTGLIISLIRRFFEGEQKETVPPSKKQTKKLKKLVGIVSLGGDAVKDADVYFE